MRVTWSIPPPSEEFLTYDLEKSISEVFEGVGIYPLADNVSDIRKKLVALYEQYVAKQKARGL